MAVKNRIIEYNFSGPRTYCQTPEIGVSIPNPNGRTQGPESSGWFEGPWGFHLKNPFAYSRLIPYKDKRQLFEVDPQVHQCRQSSRARV